MVSPQAFLLLVTISSAACVPGELIWEGQETVTSQGFLITPRRPVTAVGPMHKVCITHPIPGVVVDRDSLYVPGRPGIHVDIYLIRPDGSRDRLGYETDTATAWQSAGRIIVYPDSMHVVRESEWGILIFPPAPPSVEKVANDVICLSAYEWHEPDPHSVYRAIELRTDRSLPIRQVRWWSGQKRPLL